MVKTTAFGSFKKKVQDKKAQKTLLIYRNISISNLIYFSIQSQIMRPANSLKNYFNCSVSSVQGAGATRKQNMT